MATEDDITHGDEMLEGDDSGTVQPRASGCGGGKTSVNGHIAFTQEQPTPDDTAPVGVGPARWHGDDGVGIKGGKPYPGWNRESEMHRGARVAQDSSDPCPDQRGGRARPADVGCRERIADSP